MKTGNVKRLELALGLTRKIVGVKFLYTWAEYQDAPGDFYDKSTRFCVMVKRASEGGHACQSVAHFTGGVVGQVAHGIQRLLCGAGGNENAFAL